MKCALDMREVSLLRCPHRESRPDVHERLQSALVCETAGLEPEGKTFE